MVAACPFPANHGTPGAIRELCVALAQKGHEVHVVTYPIGDEIDIPGVHIHRVPRMPMGSDSVKIGPSWQRLVHDAGLVPKLISVIRKYDIDVIHAHNYEATIAGAMAKLATKRPLVYNGINSMADELPTYGLKPASFVRAAGAWLDRWVPRTADALLLLSDELKDYLETVGIPRERMVVIPPGIMTDAFSRGDGAKVRARHGIAPDDPVVMYTGALERFQRLDLLLRAMPQVSSRHPRATFMLVNNIPNPDAREELLSLARENGTADRLHIVESVPFRELADYLAAADVAVVPRPTCPGFPIKLLNYMAAGKAIVSYEGSAKSICHGYDGYVAKNESIEDLAAGISLLLADPELRTTLGRRARESLAGVYDWDTIASGIVCLYEQLGGTSRTPFDRNELGRYLKGEYRPRLATGGSHRASGFLQPGPVEYPRFDE